MLNKSICFSPSPFITPITGPILPGIVLIALIITRKAQRWKRSRGESPEDGKALG